jgi:hypothetical protein
MIFDVPQFVLGPDTIDISPTPAIFLHMSLITPVKSLTDAPVTLPYVLQESFTS